MEFLDKKLLDIYEELLDDSITRLFEDSIWLAKARKIIQNKK